MVLHCTATEFAGPAVNALSQGQLQSAFVSAFRLLPENPSASRFFFVPACGIANFPDKEMEETI